MRGWPAILLFLLSAPAVASAQDPSGPGVESDALRDLRMAEIELLAEAQPRVLAPGGLEVLGPGVQEGLVLPDLPVRWDSRVVEYLRYFRDDPRGHAIMAGWLRRAPRHERAAREALRAQGLPEDLYYVAMVESGFDPQARSGVGALGLWQLVPGAAGEYDLRQDHWVDERMSPEASSVAAARYLADLHTRFGSWELALAAYNMGYGALLRSIRKYNTNDFWALASMEAAMPYETGLYVAKILACAVVARNPARFGFGDVVPEQPVEVARVAVPAGTSLTLVARAVGVEESVLTGLNPELRRGRVPASEEPYALRVPVSAAAGFERALRAVAPRRRPHRAYRFRFGETLAEVAQRHGVEPAELTRLNALRDGESVEAGTFVLVPNVDAQAAPRGETPVITVPAQRFVYPDRTRVFYRVLSGDTLASVSRFFQVEPAVLRTWNALDIHAVLQPGMTLQVFPHPRVDLAQCVVWRESEVRVLVTGTDEFFAWHEEQQGRERIRHRVAAGETLATIAARYGTTPGSLSRINRMGRGVALREGQDIVVYRARTPVAPPTTEGAPIAETLERAEAPSAPQDAPAANATEATESPSATPTTPAPTEPEATDGPQVVASAASPH